MGFRCIPKPAKKLLPDSHIFLIGLMVFQMCFHNPESFSVFPMVSPAPWSSKVSARTQPCCKTYKSAAENIARIDMVKGSVRCFRSHISRTVEAAARNMRIWDFETKSDRMVRTYPYILWTSLFPQQKGDRRTGCVLSGSCARSKLRFNIHLLLELLFGV